MGEDIDKIVPPVVTEKFTLDQQKLLQQAIEIVKHDVFSDVAKRLRNYYPER